jgi:sigma-B regulation protein RsbU (phosphoserine phosphatase)
MGQLPQESYNSFKSTEMLDSAILHLLMEKTPDRIYFKDLNSKFVRVNLAHAQWLGVKKPDEVVGKSDADFFSKEHANTALAEEKKIIETGEPIVGNIQHITKRDGTLAWGSTTKMPWLDLNGKIIGTFGITRDVTHAKEAEEKLVEEHNLLRTIIDHLPSRIFVKDKKANYLLNNISHLKELGVQSQDEARGKAVNDFYSGERADQANIDDQSVLTGSHSILNQEKSNFGPEGKERWSLTTKVPIKNSHGSVVGLVGISHDITQRKKTEQELKHRSEAMEADLLMARQIQQAFIPSKYPTFPRLSNFEDSRLHFSHYYQAAASLGGDFFDLIAISDTKCGFFICDVMGHGVRAGLLTAVIRGVVQESCMNSSNDSGKVLSEINRNLIPIVEGTGQPIFATAFFGIIDTEAKTLTYSNAGHPAPLLLSKPTSSIKRLTQLDPEPATGLIEDFTYSHETISLNHNDILIGYTDGIIEASNSQGIQFTEEKLVEILKKESSLKVAEIPKKVISSVQAFTQRKDFDDDICIVVAEFK